MQELTIRPAVPDDAPRLAAIYAPYVRETAISFEYDPPTAEEFRRRMEGTLARYPYLVAQSGERIVGYAYAGPFSARPAYDWSAEVSVYVERGCCRQGVGRALYQALEACLSRMGVNNLYACIAYPETEDEYLTRNSADFHRRMGYRLAGIFHNCGCKFGRWYHMIWMEKPLAAHAPSPAPLRPFDPALLP